MHQVRIGTGVDADREGPHHALAPECLQTYAAGNAADITNDLAAELVDHVVDESLDIAWSMETDQIVSHQRPRQLVVMRQRQRDLARGKRDMQKKADALPG